MISKRFFKTKDEVEVTFELDATQIDSAAIVAEFHDWQPVAMKKVVKSKTFKYKTRLPKNAQFEFRYLVNDSEWVNDTNADNYIVNHFGEENCVVTTVDVS